MSKLDYCTTGYYGNQKTLRASKVHIRLSNGKVLCGYRPTKLHSYYQCSPRLELDYIDCKKCKHEALNIALDDILNETGWDD
jgi:hypothetical protein